MADATPTGATPETETENLPEGLGDAGKAAIKAERDARQAAERKTTEHEKELAQLRKEKSDAATAKAKADEESAAKRGEFEALAQTRADERDAAKAEAEAIAKKLERANAAMVSVLADRIKALTDLGNKDLSDAFPTDAEPLDQLDWLNDPRTKAAMTTAEESKRVETARTNGRVPATLRPSGFTQDDAQQAEYSRLARSGKYGI